MTDETKTAVHTEYVVLQRYERPKQEGNASSGITAVGIPDPGQAWLAEVKTVTALNAQAAIKAAAGADGEGTFIAVPARSWKPLTRKIEKVAKDVWS